MFLFIIIYLITTVYEKCVIRAPITVPVLVVILPFPKTWRSGLQTFFLCLWYRNFMSWCSSSWRKLFQCSFYVLPTEATFIELMIVFPRAVYYSRKLEWKLYFWLMPSRRVMASISVYQGHHVRWVPLSRWYMRLYFGLIIIIIICRYTARLFIRRPHLSDSKKQNLRCLFIFTFY